IISYFTIFYVLDLEIYVLSILVTKLTFYNSELYYMPICYYSQEKKLTLYDKVHNLHGNALNPLGNMLHAGNTKDKENNFRFYAFRYNNNTQYISCCISQETCVIKAASCEVLRRFNIKASFFMVKHSLFHLGIGWESEIALVLQPMLGLILKRSFFLLFNCVIVILGIIKKPEIWQKDQSILQTTLVT
ncbi:hypothetical protein ACJX0J_016112, partial [Zea mays]